MGLFIRTFASSGPDGKEKWPMGSIPGLCKNVLLGLIPNSEIHLLWDCPYKLLCWVVPMAKKNDLWDQSHRPFFFAIGTSRPKSSYWQSQYKCISWFGISPNGKFLQRPDPIGNFSLPSGPLKTKVHMDSPTTNESQDFDPPGGAGNPPAT